MKARHAALALFLGAGAAAVVLWQRERLEQGRRVRALEAQVRDLGERLERVKASSIVAEARVLSSRPNPGGKGERWTIRFTEFDREGRPVSSVPEFDVDGEEVYFDALSLEFEGRFVEQGDGLRGKSLLLFRRSFGDRQQPAEGPLLWSRSGDEIPPVYRPSTLATTPEALAFERDLWRRFWTLAADPEAAKRAGVRAADVKAAGIRPHVGQVYRLTLRHGGGLAIEPLFAPSALERK
ncbi:MAG TPA: hypothetical protein VFI25_10210 [Planctomycetota bacterium]|jgi:hypothetical protein|nr:hypothetical protein [Planctomycetota bacterium]